MGFTLLSLDGYRLTRVKRFKLLCRACKTINLNVERKFCERCGNSTLAKVSVYINDKGEVTYFENPRRRINLRGTRFSIPKPKVGRDNGNLILREDELMMGEKAQKVRALKKAHMNEDNQLKNTLQGNYWAGGSGYQGQVSSLLYENGARGGIGGKSKTLQLE
jgi:RNA-binding protein NOB1